MRRCTARRVRGSFSLPPLAVQHRHPVAVDLQQRYVQLALLPCGTKRVTGSLVENVAERNLGTIRDVGTAALLFVGCQRPIDRTVHARRACATSMTDRLNKINVSKKALSKEGPLPYRARHEPHDTKHGFFATRFAHDHNFGFKTRNGARVCVCVFSPRKQELLLCLYIYIYICICLARFYPSPFFSHGAERPQRTASCSRWDVFSWLEMGTALSS